MFVFNSMKLPSLHFLISAVAAYAPAQLYSAKGGPLAQEIYHSPLGEPLKIPLPLCFLDQDYGVCSQEDGVTLECQGCAQSEGVTLTDEYLLIGDITQLTQITLTVASTTRNTSATQSLTIIPDTAQTAKRSLPPLCNPYIVEDT